MFNKNWILYSIVILVFFGCNKDDELPDNPYDQINYGVDDGIDNLDPNSITSIHRDILLPKCSTPGCHDGTFEPDFRTVMSSYHTLLYHRIVKNSPDSAYTYRVVPFDTSQSVLQKRLNLTTFANTNDRMPQDNIGTGLPKEDLDRISQWILNGAKDIEGNVAVMPNTEPNFEFYWMIEGAPNPFTITPPFNVLSVPENRDQNLGHLPVILDTAMWAYIMIEVQDDSTEMKDLTNLKLAFSYDKDDFSNPIKEEVGNYLPGNNPAIYFNFEASVGVLKDTVVYMRMYVNDGDHIADTYFPRDESYDYYKTFWSFKIIEGSHQ